MNKETEKKIKNLQSLSLNKKAKVDMRTRLSEYADINPMRSNPHPEKKARGFGVFGIFTNAKPAFVAVFGLVLITTFTGAGVSQAARGSIPGDTLYAVKVNFNEPIQTFFAFTPIQEAEVALKQAKERLSEITQLSNRNTLDESNQQKLENSYRELTDKAQRIAVEMQGKNKRNSDQVRSIITQLDETYKRLITDDKKTTPLPTDIASDTEDTDEVTSDIPDALPSEEEPLPEKEEIILADEIQPVDIIDTNETINREDTVTRAQLLEQIERAKIIIAEAESLLRTNYEYAEAQKTPYDVQELLDVSEDDIEESVADNATSTDEIVDDRPRRRGGSSRSNTNTNDTPPSITTPDDPPANEGSTPSTGGAGTLP